MHGARGGPTIWDYFSPRQANYWNIWAREKKTIQSKEEFPQALESFGQALAENGWEENGTKARESLAANRLGPSF